MSSFLTKPKSVVTLGDSQFPGHYGDAQQEYHRLFAEGGFLEDASTDWLQVKGPDTESFLQGMLTLDLRSIEQGQGQSGFALDASGKIFVFLKVYRIGPQQFWLACPAGTIQELEKHLSRYIIMEDVTLAIPGDFLNLIFLGPKAVDLAKSLSDQETAPFFASMRAGMTACEFPLEQSKATSIIQQAQAANLTPIGWEAYDQARIEAFEPQFPQDIEPDTNPVIYGLEQAISAKKGCYIGQETVAMTRDRGRPPFVLALLRCPSPTETPHSIGLFMDGKAIGHSRSSTFSTKTHSVMRIGVVKFKVMADGINFLDDEMGNRWQIDKFNYPSTS